MKKLMITACAIAFAAISQASTYNWQSNSGWFDIEGDDVAGTVYVFDANQVALSTVVDALATTGDWKQYFTANDGDTPFMNSAVLNYGMWGTSGSRDTAKGAGKGVSGNASDTIASAFFVILNDDVADATQFWASEKAMDLAITGDIKDGAALQFNPSDTTITWSNIAAVPEPTSGLLLLLGVAGLALRRRRA